MSRFVPKALTNSSYIRLVRILPPFDEDGQDGINLYMVETDLADPFNYTALSYTWGAPYEGLPPEWDDPNVTKTVLVNGQKLQVQLNLHSALAHLRTTKCHKLLWIDAISIDQSNILERNQQVGMMKLIYIRAQETIIWLGPDNGKCRALLDRMTEFNNSLPAKLLQGTEFLVLLGMEQAQSLPGSASLRHLILTRASFTSELCEFFRRKWFERTWIIQEVTLSRRPCVMCGLAIASWAAVAATGMFVTLDKTLNQGGFHITSVEASNAVKILSMSRSFMSASKGVGTVKLLDIVSSTDNFRATDPRDKIFGMLGLVEKIPDSFPNYGLSDRQVYTEFTKHYLEHEKNYYILGHRWSFDCGFGLPSWVPDWISGAQGTPISRRGDHNNAEDFYDASMGTSIEFKFQQNPDDGSSELVIIGLIVDKLSQVGPALDWEKGHQWDPQTPPSIRHLESAAMSNRVIAEWRNILETYFTSDRPLELEHNLRELSINNASSDRPLEHDIYSPSLNNAIHSPFLNNAIHSQDKVPPPIYAPTKEPLQRAIAETLLTDFIMISPEAHGRMSTNPPLWEAYAKDPSKYENLIFAFAVHRRLVISEDGYMGIGPGTAQVGDVIAIFPAGTVPYLLRPRGDGRYWFLGQCYVHRLMDGQAMAKLGRGEAKVGEIVLS